MSTYKNPGVLTIADPINVDAAIQEIQKALEADLVWLDKSFGKSEYGRTKEGDREIIYPEVYTAEKRKPYQNVLPNNKLKSQSFFRVEDPLSVPDPALFTQNTFNLRLSLIFWFNLDAIGRISPYNTLEYRFTEVLLSEVLAVLKNSGVQVLNVYYKPENVFQGYTINHLEQQELKHPYSGFRIELLTSFSETC